MVVSTMAPEHQQRDLVSQFLGEKLVWFYIHAPLDICMQRDPKGIYKRALEGQIKQLINFPSRFPDRRNVRITSTPSPKILTTVITTSWKRRKVI